MGTGQHIPLFQTALNSGYHGLRLGSKAGGVAAPGSSHKSSWAWEGETDTEGEAGGHGHPGGGGLRMACHDSAIGPGAG